VDIGFLENVYSSEWASLSPKFAAPKKNGTKRVFTDFQDLDLLFERRISPISYYKDWVHDPCNGRVYLCHGIGLDEFKPECKKYI
jgi:hypothetical protein